MIFKPYSSVLDANMLREFDPASTAVLKELNDWIVQEKIKGVQFSLWITREEKRGANRNRFLEEHEPYFNWKRFRDQFTPKLEAIRERINAREIVVYGEIFGGVYPNIASKLATGREPGEFPLYRGVYYADVNAFFAFDIVIDGMWQPQWYIYDLLDEIGMLYAYEITRGRLAKVLRLDPDQRESDVHEIFGLPRLKNNMCAGVIIRPREPAFLPDGRRILIQREVVRGSC